MKLSNYHIHTLAKKLFHHDQSIKRVKLMHPKRDWLIGVLVGIMIVSVMIAWSAYTYLEKRDAVGLSETNIDIEIPVYRSDTVEDALELFAKRKEAFEQLNQTGVPATSAVTESSDDQISTTTSSTTNEINEDPVVEVTEADIGQSVNIE